MPSLTRAQRLQRRADRLRRLADKIRPTTPDAPAHVLMRRLPSGRAVPASKTGRTWNDIVAKPTGLAKVTGGRALDADHPSRKHDTTAVLRDVHDVTPLKDGLDRRTRREMKQANASDAKKHRRNESSRDFRLPIDRAGVSRGVRRYMAGDPDPAVAARLQAEHDEQTAKIRAAADARREARATR